jgi:hypothetical protein
MRRRVEIRSMIETVTRIRMMMKQTVCHSRVRICSDS